MRINQLLIVEVFVRKWARALTWIQLVLDILYRFIKLNVLNAIYDIRL